MTYFLSDTRNQIYLDQILIKYQPNSRVGLSYWNNMRPYLPSEEAEWAKEIKLLAVLINGIKGNSRLINEIRALFEELEDVELLLENLLEHNLEALDLLTDGFRLKQFLWFSHQLSQILQKVNWEGKLETEYEAWIQNIEFNWGRILQELQPNDIIQGQFYKAFSFEDLDDDYLRRLRLLKRKLLKKERDLQNLVREQFYKDYGIGVNYERYVFIPKEKKHQLNQLKLVQLQFIREEVNELIFYLPFSKKEVIIQKQINRIGRQIETKEKERVLEVLKILDRDIPFFLEAYRGWGKFELIFQKAIMALEMNAYRPQLTTAFNEQRIRIEEGYHPYFNDLWTKRSMLPLSLEIEDSQIVLYGANMSGKTIVLRTIGFLQALAQLGFFVPAQRFESFFFAHLSLLTGDAQNMEEGLSSFASEMNRVGQELVLTEPSFYLLDEIGKGTNPLEGEALAIAISRYLRKEDGRYSVVVTHFPKLILEKELTLYEMKEFSLTKVIQGEMVYEGISIAKKFNLPLSIIKEAQDCFRGNVND